MTENEIPVHVGIIMDGNGRWAKKRLLPRSLGHKAGMDKMISITEEAQKLGVKYLTLYALSTENLSRPKEEVDGLIELMRKYFSVNAEKLLSRGAAIKVIGDLSVFPQDLQSAMCEWVKKSPQNAPFTLILAINYGTRAEILRAVNLAIEGGKPLDEEGFNRLLYTGGIPDPDLIIRTGGEKRLSNFLTYQAVYSELYFSDVLFPDFNAAELKKAIKDYGKRTRRFGKV